MPSFVEQREKVLCCGERTRMESRGLVSLLVPTVTCMFANILRHAARRSFATKALDPAQIEKDSARILRVVEKRILERQETLVQVSLLLLPWADSSAQPLQKGSSVTDIKRSKQLKESAPLQDAWDEWNSTKQVSTIYLHNTSYNLTRSVISSF